MSKSDKKILIVEDDEDFIYIIQNKFASAGLALITAKDGQQGVEMNTKENPDLILSDISMPKMDGIEMAQKIRETDKDVPIIFLTNIKDVDYTKNAQTSGNFDYLIKSDTRIGEIVEKVKTKLGIE